MNSPVSLFWFRRDLRIEDNVALYHALKDEYPVLPVFIFDSQILDKLPPSDARVVFIHKRLELLQKEFVKLGTTLDVRIGKPDATWQQLTEDYSIARVYANRDYEPYARQRDEKVYYYLQAKEIPFISKKDHVLFEKNEILKKDQRPYTVYTPFSKQWKSKLTPAHTSSMPSAEIHNWHKRFPIPIPSLEQIGFKSVSTTFPSIQPDQKIIKDYHLTRDIPGIAGTSRLSVHLRFGTISARKLVKLALKLNEKFLNELIWREFYIYILWHFPHVVSQNFNRKYDFVQWRNDPGEFKKWCDGMTGYPIVDAGMRELNHTGYMHNRVRMIVSSFLTKHLLINWQWGEAYFAEKLLDFELASNNGGWQWAAGTGVDAAPYFRVFNPYLQTEKFDPKQSYINQWIPEIGSSDYPLPMVDHSQARQRALDAYKSALGT